MVLLNHFIIYSKIASIINTLKSWSAAIRIYTNKGLFGYLAGLIAPYIGAVFSWLSTIPVVGWVILVIIVGAALWFAKIIVTAYFIYKKGVEITVKWKWFVIPYLNVVYR